MLNLAGVIIIPFFISLYYKYSTDKLGSNPYREHSHFLVKQLTDFQSKYPLNSSGDARIFFQPGSEDPDRQVQRTEAEGTDIRAENRAVIRVTQDVEHDRNRQGADQRDPEKGESGEVLAQHHLAGVHRQGHEHLESAPSHVLRPQPHADRRDEDAEQQRKVAEEAAHVSGAVQEEREHEQP